MRSNPSPMPSFRAHKSLLFTSLWLCCALSAGATEAARVLYAHGDVMGISANGDRQKLAKGDVVTVGTTLVVGTGKLQLRFVDGALMSFKPHTRFEVSAYQFKPQDAKETKAETRLIEGGLRTLTGAIAKVNRQAYRMETASGTIGIRGTQFSTDGKVTTLYEGAAQLCIPAKQGVGAPNVCPMTVYSGYSSGEHGSPQKGPKNNMPAFSPPSNTAQTGTPNDQSFKNITTAINNEAPTANDQALKKITTAIKNDAPQALSPSEVAGVTPSPSRTEERLERHNLLVSADQVLRASGINTFDVPSLAPPALQSISGSFETLSGQEDNLANGLTPRGLGHSEDAISVRWGDWLGGAQFSSPRPVAGFGESNRIFWISGTPLSALPNNAELSYTVTGYAGTIDNHQASSTPINAGQLRSTLTVNLADGATSLLFGLKPTPNDQEILFSRAQTVYDRSSNQFSVSGLGSDSGAHVLTAKGQLYGPNASHAGLGFVITPEGRPSPGAMSKAYGVVGYKKVGP